MNKPPPLAIVTGGTSGIGYAIAERLMDDGYDILITGRDVARGQQAAQTLQLNHDTSSTFVALDANDWEAYGVLLEAAGTRGINALVASAAFGQQAHLIDTPSDLFLSMLSLNIAAPHHLIRTLHPRMAVPSSIVLISSDAGVDGEQALGAYSVSKAGLNMLGKMLALDLAPNGIRVNVVCPGDTVPGMRYLLRPGETQRAEEDYLSWPIPPRGRLGLPQDTAEYVAFLVSSRADFIIGTVTLVDGGSRAGRADPH